MLKNLSISDSTKKLILWKWCISGLEPGFNSKKCNILYNDFLIAVEKEKNNKDKNSNN